MSTVQHLARAILDQGLAAEVMGALAQEMRIGGEVHLLPRNSRSIHNKGYSRVYVPTGSPLRRYCNTGGWQYAHRLAAALKLGRRLKAYEHVHHVDQDQERDGEYSLAELVAVFDERFQVLNDVDHNTIHAGPGARFHRGEWQACSCAHADWPVEAGDTPPPTT
ncbi:MAG: hypothetical protein K0U98_14970 [Deltaproteobacteria bacterium]|nr:hypothetical protein [Deltaproteobacteria bacterium]